MAGSINDYSSHAADWRASLKRNNHRTYGVIATYILIYLSLGLLVDLFYQSGHYPMVPLSRLLQALLTFELTPYATLILTGVALISLLVTFKLYDRLMLLGTEYTEVTPESTSDLQEKQLYHIIEELKIAAGLTYMPRVFILHENTMNAFASGYSEKSAMVAITQGLLDKLNRAEITAVMAHEISHIRHMDIKLTLMASVLTNIMVILIDILFFTTLYSGRGGNGEGRNRLFFVIMIVRYVLPIVTVLITLYLSRTREYKADAGAIEITRENKPLASALLKIHHDYRDNADYYQEEEGEPAHENVRRQAYIFDPVQAGFQPLRSMADLFSTHPSLEKRLAAMGFKRRDL